MGTHPFSGRAIENRELPTCGGDNWPNRQPRHALALLRHQQHDQIAAKIGRGHRLVATMPSVQKHWAFESLATGDWVDPDMAQGQTGTKA